MSIFQTDLQKLDFDLDEDLTGDDDELSRSMQRPIPEPLGPTGQNERITIRVHEEFVDVIDELIDAGVYPNRSEAIRAGAESIVADTVREIEAADGGRSR
jgi:hypothetical protein